MATPPPSSSSSSSVKEKDVPVEVQTRGNEVNRLVLPEDGYEWKKYGQKYITKIKKNRSYLKCKENNCKAKKRVEWPPCDPSNMRIVYEGGHNHPPRSTSFDQQASGSNSDPNPYDLRVQVFGQPSEPL